MSEEKRAGLEAALSWEEWLRQGLLTAEAAARLQALARRREQSSADSSHPRRPAARATTTNAGGKR